MRTSICAALAVCLASPSFAQSQPTAAQLPNADEVSNRDTLTVAVGGAVLPDYEGSDDYRIIPAGAVRGQYHRIGFTTRGSYLYVDFVPRVAQARHRLGPIVGARFNSRRHINDPVVKLLPRRNTALEVGAFAGIGFHGLTNPYDHLAFRVDVLHDVASAHQSTTFSPNVEFSTPLSRTTYASANVGAEFVSNKFADYYFSITPADSLASGIAGLQRRRRDEELEGGAAAQPVDYRRPAAWAVDLRHWAILAPGRRFQTLADRLATRQRQPVARRARAGLTW